MDTDQLKSLLEEFHESVRYDCDLKKKIGLTLGAELKLSIRQIN